MDIHYWKRLFHIFTIRSVCFCHLVKGYSQFYKLLKFTCYIKDERTVPTGSQFIIFYLNQTTCGTFSLHNMVCGLECSLTSMCSILHCWLTCTSRWNCTSMQGRRELSLACIECSCSRSDSANTHCNSFPTCLQP